MSGNNIKLPLASVIMSVYAGNHPEELKSSLLSMVNQDYPNLEIVLVYDGPVSDGIGQVITDVRKNTNVPFHIIPLKNNLGLGPALNTAITAAKGDFLVRMDSDDYSMPDRVSSQLGFLLRHDDVDVVGCLMEDIFVNGERYVLDMPLTHNDCVAAFSWRHPINHPTAVFRRHFFEKAGMYSADARLDEDSVLWLAGMKSGCIFANINEVKYKRSLDQRFFQRRKNINEIMTVFRIRLRIISELHYGIKGYAYAFARLFLLLLPKQISSALYHLRIHISRNLKK